MKKVFFGLITVVLVLGLMTTPATAAPGGKNAGCATIQDGTIVDSINDEPITLGFDEYGYNYQAHLFRGAYSDYRRGLPVPFPNVDLQMKWNDAWLSNKDCDDDDLLDRHNGFDSYIGSGAWLTNHDIGFNDDGDRWTYFVKIVAVPVGAYLDDDEIWYTADDIEIGPDIWGQFAVIEQIITGDIPSDFVDYDLPFVDPYWSPSGPGLGKW